MRLVVILHRKMFASRYLFPSSFFLSFFQILLISLFFVVQCSCSGRTAFAWLSPSLRASDNALLHRAMSRMCLQNSYSYRQQQTQWQRQKQGQWYGYWRSYLIDLNALSSSSSTSSIALSLPRKRTRFDHDRLTFTVLGASSSDQPDFGQNELVKEGKSVGGITEKEIQDSVKRQKENGKILNIIGNKRIEEMTGFRVQRNTVEGITFVKWKKKIIYRAPHPLRPRPRHLPLPPPPPHHHHHYLLLLLRGYPIFLTVHINKILCPLKVLLKIQQ